MASKKETFTAIITPAEVAKAVVPFRARKTIIDEAGPSNRTIPNCAEEETEHTDKIEYLIRESSNIPPFLNTYHADLMKSQLSIMQQGDVHYNRVYETWMNEVKYDHIFVSGIAGSYASIQATRHLREYFGHMRQKISVLEERKEAHDKEITELKNKVKKLEEKIYKQRSRIKKKTKNYLNAGKMRKK